MMPSEDFLPCSPPGWDLPGHGDRPADCGRNIVAYCECCGHYWETQKTCDKKTCPNCWRRWAFLGGRRAGLRAWAARKIILGRRRGRLLHIVISMPYNGEDESDTRKRAYSICKEKGIVGGLCIFHHCRDRDDLGRVPDGYIHYHIVGLAPGNVSPGMGQREIFKVIRDGRMGDFRGFRRTGEVVACLQYLLTHAAVKEGKHTLTWFGAMSYNKLSNSTLEDHCPDLVKYMNETRKRPCPECGSRETGCLGWDVDQAVEQWHKEHVPDGYRLAYALERFDEGVIG